MAEDVLHYAQGESDTRPWGCWLVLEAAPNYTVKRIEVLAGKRLSLQYHHFRSEHWNVVAGQGVVTLGGDQIRVEAGSHIYIPKETKHRIENNGTENLVFIEVQFGERLDENDIVRIEDDFGR